MTTPFSPTQGEIALVNQIFSKHDPQKFGVITGDVAVRIFGSANLSANILGQIWAIADSDNQGFLARKGVSVAVRLIGWAQKGETVSADLINKRECDGFSHCDTCGSSLTKLDLLPSLLAIPRPRNPAGPLAPLRSLQSLRPLLVFRLYCLRKTRRNSRGTSTAVTL
jgi:epidermal growth factor receptor substrate 15